MAVYYARATGNVNGTIWATTPTGTASNLFPSFTNADTLMANSFTVTLNVNTTVLEVRNDTANSATANGSFTLTNGVTLTSNVIVGSGSTTVCVTFSQASPSTCSIVGNISALSTATQSSVANNSTGIINITGNCTGGAANLCNAVSNNSNGTINITGICTGGTVANAHGAYNALGGTINITGSANGGSVSNCYGAQNVGVGTINITGTATSGSLGGVGANNGSTGTLTVTRAKGNGFGNGSVGITSAVGVSASQNGSTRVSEIEYGDLGQSPTSGPIILTDSTSNVALFYRTSGGKKTLVDINNPVTLVPSSGNVRSGVSYNYGANIGSCIIPHPNSVVYGVPVDNTIGSGLLSPVTVWNALTSSIGTSGTIGERLKNISTVATVGKQLEGVL
ncbi:MAG: hypothetical protein EBS98_01985 [Chitinophagia bacterium]|nr:hypothetical protein [Chitinophagia bacterium]